jgi:hypothetical protein
MMGVDLNNDGMLDVLQFSFATYSNQSSSLGISVSMNPGAVPASSPYFPSPVQKSLYFNQGLYQSSYQSLSNSISSADLNGDGFKDLLVWVSNRLVPIYNTGGSSPNFSFGPAVEDDWDPISLLSVADLNGDGTQDVMTYTDRRYLGFYGNGRGLIDRRPMIDVENPVNVQVVDWDLDGNQDILSVAVNGNLWLSRNLGQATFAAPSLLAAGTEPNSIAPVAGRALAGYADYDGYPDGIVTSFGPNVTVAFNGSAGGGNTRLFAQTSDGTNAVYVDFAPLANSAPYTSWIRVAGKTVRISHGSATRGAFVDQPSHYVLNANATTGA